MIQVTVYFWAESADERTFVVDMSDDATILDLKNKLVDTATDTPFKGDDVTAFEIADHRDPILGLADDQTLANDRSYDARME